MKDVSSKVSSAVSTVHCADVIRTLDVKVQIKMTQCSTTPSTPCWFPTVNSTLTVASGISIYVSWHSDK